MQGSSSINDDYIRYRQHR